MFYINDHEKTGMGEHHRIIIPFCDIPLYTVDRYNRDVWTFTFEPLFYIHTLYKKNLTYSCYGYAITLLVCKDGKHE